VIAGQRRPATGQPSLVVDYKDVLDQAVLNERHRVIREARRRIEAIRLGEDYLGHGGLTGKQVKAESLGILDTVERETP